MWNPRRVWRIFDYSELDQQIEKFRQLAFEYKKSNKSYYGEYLSSFLFGD
ncbi:hypothetical protein [Geobacter sp. AOG2]|nr:hypothetical protein [Geobacter sp. AOG2]GFE62674.1 hypothetical protein AOG2_32620 [Geobacter sp. AOG2]